MIRMATPRDAAGIHAIYAPIVRETFISFDEGIAGFAYAGEHRERLAYQWAVDVSCYLQGFCNAFAGIALPNAASVALHESVDFTPLGC